MPEKKNSTVKGKALDTALSVRTKKQIDSLPEHAQHIFKNAHANAVRQYQNPAKRRGGKSQSAEEVAHKAAWAQICNAILNISSLFSEIVIYTVGITGGIISLTDHHLKSI